MSSAEAGPSSASAGVKSEYDLLVAQPFAQNEYTLLKKRLFEEQQITEDSELPEGMRLRKKTRPAPLIQYARNGHAEYAALVRQLHALLKKKRHTEVLNILRCVDHFHNHGGEAPACLRVETTGSTEGVELAAGPGASEASPIVIEAELIDLINMQEVEPPELVVKQELGTAAAAPAAQAPAPVPAPAPAPAPAAVLAASQPPSPPAPFPVVKQARRRP